MRGKPRFYRDHAGSPGAWRSRLGPL